PGFPPGLPPVVRGLCTVRARSVGPPEQPRGRCMRLRPALLLTVFLTAGTFLIAGCGSNDPASAPPAGGGQVPAAGGGGGANANQVDCPTSAMVGQHLGFTPKGDVDVTRG